MTYILQLEKARARELTVYDLSQLLQHRLQYNIVNFSVKEVEQLQNTLAHYKKELEERNGVVSETLLVRPTCTRGEVVEATCALSNCNTFD